MINSLSRFNMALSKYVELEKVSYEKFCEKDSSEEVSVKLRTEMNSSATLHVFQNDTESLYSVETNNSSVFFRSQFISIFKIVDILKSWFPQIQILNSPKV